MDNIIKDLRQSWDGMPGSAIEQLIKSQLSSKVGFLHRTEKLSDNCFHVYGFADEASYRLWNENPVANAALLLCDISLPDTSSTATSYVVNLLREGNGNIVTIDNSVKLRLRFTSQEYNPINQSTQDTSEGGVLSVQTRLNDDAQWVTKGGMKIASLPASSTAWTDVDITDLVASGPQQVRIIVKGETTEMNTRYLKFDVTKTTLGLGLSTLWEQPVTDGVLRLGYYISGAVAKTLHVLVDGRRKLEFPLGSATYTETPYQINISDEDGQATPVMTHGVHSVKAWLAVNDSDVVSDALESQHMVVADTDNTTPYVILNNLKKKLSNWANETLFSYAVYAPSVETLPLSLQLKDYTGNIVYMNSELGAVVPGQRYEFTNVVEIESELPDLDAYMHFTSGETALREPVGFSVDNTANFAPTRGFSFGINPRNRTNSEVTPLSIVNSANGAEIESAWNGFTLVSDGWAQDAEGARCLRIPTGSSVEIAHETFADYIDTDNRRSLTVELDFASRKITNEDAPIIRMCSYNADGTPVGLEIKPTLARFMSQNLKASNDQDAGFLRNARTHLVLNIVYGMSGTAVNMVRMFVNGVLSREFTWEANDTFVQYVDGKKTSQGIRLGSTGADLDIYNIRIYRTALSSAEVLKNYISTQPTSAAKLALRDANDILGDNGQISYIKAHAKYQTICWEIPEGSHLPAYGDTKAYEVLAPITTIGRKTAQGIRDEYLYNWFLLGQGTSSMTYYRWNIAMNPKTKTEDAEMLKIKGTWTATDGTVTKGAYAMTSNLPAASKLVAKANWASSQQTHKAGSVNAFNDLWKEVCVGSSITKTEGFENCRVAVYQEEFLGFVKIGNAEPTFCGLYTFGPGKGDKPTFGYDSAKFPHQLMLEGCDNGQPLTNHRIPWNEDVTLVDGIYMYNGGKQWEVCMGDAANVQYFIDAFNFAYLNSPHIHPFIGTLESLQSDASVNKQHFYWITQASGTNARYDLFRFDALTGKWVDAGVAKISTGKYEKLNLATDLGITPDNNLWGEINTQFRNTRIERFRNEAHRYFKKDDALFHSCFVTLIAATDNRAKNTYLYLDRDGDNIVIRFAQDDLDSIKKTDNEGRLNKPYYIETHDRNADGQPYWNGEENAMYDLFELAWPSEMRATMKRTLTAMASITSRQGVVGACNSDPLMQFMENYYYHIARSIPAVAYNETARIRYESAAIQWDKGNYTASVHPLAQSLGSQLENELDWSQRRMVYLSSYASYGQFEMNGKGSLTFRSVKTLAGNNPSYTFALTPVMWLYPSVSSGSSTYYGTGYDAPQRVRAGETFVLSGVPSDGNTNIQVHGIDYYSNIGEFGNKALQGEGFNVAGANLLEFKAIATPSEFRAPKVTATAPMLKVLSLRGRSSVCGHLDLSAQTDLEELDISGTNITSFTLGNAAKIKKLALPATLTKLELDSLSNLDTASIEGTSRLTDLKLAPNTPGAKAILEDMAVNNAPIESISLIGVDWGNFKTSTVMYLAKLKKKLGDRFKVTGTVKVAAGQTMTLANLQEVSAAFGVFDSADPAQTLAVDYSNCYVRLTDFRISQAGDYFEAPGQRTLTPILTPTNANMIRSVEWSIDNDTCATIDPATGLLNVLRVDSDLKPTATVSCTITLLHGTTMTRTVTLHFFPKEPMKIFDPVYHDGSYGLGNGDGKTLIGICFDVIDMQDRTKRRKIFALKDIGKSQWGPADNLKDSTGGVIMPADVPYIPNKGIANSTQSPESMWDSEAEIWKTQPFGTASADIGDIYLADSEEMATIGETYRRTTVYDNDTTIAEPGATDTVPAGSVMTAGQYYQRKLIQDRNRLMRLFGKQIPAAQYLRTEWEDMSIKHNDNYYKSQGYGAFSLCYAYEPVLSDVNHITELIPEARVHNWYLPTAGELMQISCCLTMISQAVEGDKLWPIRQMLTQGILTGMTANTWSSSEPSSYYAWYCASGWTGYYLKNNEFAVRPVAAF